MIVDLSRALVQTEDGVIAPPPPSIQLKIRELVEAELKKEPHTTNGVALTVDLQTGVNFVIAHRTKSGWELDGYFGSKWDGDVRAGVEIAKRW